MTRVCCIARRGNSATSMRSVRVRAALRLRGGAPPYPITVFVIGPDYHRSGKADVVLHPLATLEQLAAAVLDIYFGRGRVPPVELRLMPSNIIVAEGFTLLYSSLLTRLHPANTLMTEAGVVDRSVVQLYLKELEPPPPG